MYTEKQTTWILTQWCTEFINIHSNLPIFAVLHYRHTQYKGCSGLSLTVYSLRDPTIKSWTVLTRKPPRYTALDISWTSFDWVVVLRPTWHKIHHFGDVPQANLLAWYGKTKPNTTKAHIHQSKEMYYNTKKTKARFSRLLWHPAWKRRGPTLVSALHKFVIYLLTLDTHLQPWDRHRAAKDPYCSA